MLHSSLLHSALLYSTLRRCLLLYSTLRQCLVIVPALICFTPLCSTVLFPVSMSVDGGGLCSTVPYLVYSVQGSSTQIHFTLFLRRNLLKGSQISQYCFKVFSSSLIYVLFVLFTNLTCHVRLGSSELARRRDQYNSIQTSYKSIAELFHKLVRENQLESQRS